eukprot:INCI3351.1.p1 GENE.INCI3351.1~~INCI3351.1.p1  ORF type:complete len:177 (+),score=15.51 INCI3351.1:487-1017(+)
MHAPRIVVMKIRMRRYEATVGCGTVCRWALLVGVSAANTCKPSSAGPFYSCKVDDDCSECPSPSYYFAFCDNFSSSSICHFNNYGKGVRLKNGPTDDMNLYQIHNSSSCSELTVYSGNSRYQCFGDFWAKHELFFADFGNGTCPSRFHECKANTTKICEGQGAPTSTLRDYACENP